MQKAQPLGSIAAPSREPCEAKQGTPGIEMPGVPVLSNSAFKSVFKKWNSPQTYPTFSRKRFINRIAVII